MPFTKRLEWSERALPCPVPWGLSADSLSFTLAFWGPESVMAKQSMFINNQDSPLGWAHVLVSWMRFPSDVINLILLLLLFSHSVVSNSL